MSHGADTHSGVFGRTDSAGSWGYSGDKATLLAGTQTEWELLEDGIAEVLMVFRIGLVEDHHPGLGSLLHYTGRSRTLLRESPRFSTATVHKNEGYRIWGASPISPETIFVIWLAL